MAAIDSRYARALAAVVAEQKLDAAKVQTQLNDFSETLSGSAELREVLENPSIAETQKLKVIDAIAAKLGMSGAVRNFIAVITHHERLNELQTIAAAYAALADEESGVADAEIVSAQPLNEASKKLLEDRVSKLTGGQRVRATYSEDASLLGGAVIRIGSTVYDGSVRAQLNQLRQTMVS